MPEELLRIMRDYERLLGKAIWQHCIIVVTNCDPIPAYKERQDFVASSFAAELKTKLRMPDSLPVFRTSTVMDAADSTELGTLKAFLRAKSTYYTCPFFTEIRMAYTAGGASKALSHALTRIDQELDKFFDV